MLLFCCGAMSSHAQQLMAMTLSLAEIAPLVELF